MCHPKLRHPTFNVFLSCCEPKPEILNADSQLFTPQQSTYQSLWEDGKQDQSPNDPQSKSHPLLLPLSTVEFGI